MTYNRASCRSLPLDHSESAGRFGTSAPRRWCGAVELLKRLRAAVIAERSALLASGDKTGRAALHDRRAINRLDVVVVEIDAVLRHLRRAMEAAGTQRRGAA